MISSESQFYKVILDEKNVDLTWEEAQLAAIGGRSQIFDDHKDRMKRILSDQFLGQAGSLAIHLYSFQSDVAVKLYEKSREPFKINKFAGDNGMDIIDTPLDIKTSKVKKVSRKPILNYTLPIRPAEFKRDWVYVLGLIKTNEIRKKTPRQAIVNIVGWASSDMFGSIRTYGIFQNTYALDAHQLNPLPLPDHIWPENLRPYLKNHDNGILTL